MLEAAASSTLFPCDNSIGFERNTFATKMFQGGDTVFFLQIGLISWVEETHISLQINQLR
jgi:hypothetical protein